MRVSPSRRRRRRSASFASTASNWSRHRCCGSRSPLRCTRRCGAASCGVTRPSRCCSEHSRRRSGALSPTRLLWSPGPSPTRWVGRRPTTPTTSRSHGFSAVGSSRSMPGCGAEAHRLGFVIGPDRAVVGDLRARRRRAPRVEHPPAPPVRSIRAAAETRRVVASGRDAAIPDMSDRELLDKVRRMRGIGMSPKEIARALRGASCGGRTAGAQRRCRGARNAGRRAPAGRCCMSPGWSRELLVESREDWDDVDLGPHGPAGVALVLVARGARHDRVSVAGYLLDTFCLGVKNALGPEDMRGRDLPDFVRMYFTAFPAAALAAPIELARHLVFGCSAFAGALFLGFSPHPDFETVRGPSRRARRAIRDHLRAREPGRPSVRARAPTTIRSR